MAGSVIDSLVVTLGLDSKDFAQGVKGSTEQLAGFTRRLAGMFLAVRGLEDVVGYFKDLHAQLAEIGFTSRNLGVAGTEIKRLGEVAELFGGQMTDATETVQGLQNAVFNLRFKGQMSESLQMMQRFGVSFLTATGHARELKDILRDQAKAIERQARVAGLNAGERYQMALSFGNVGGMASAVAQGGKALEDALKKSTVDQKPLAERTIQAQVKLDQDLTRSSEHLAALNSNILSRLTPLISQVNQWLMKLANDLIPRLVKAIEGLINFFKNPPPWFKAIENAAVAIAQLLGPIGTLTAAILGIGALLGVGGALVGALTSLPVLLGITLGALLSGVKSGGLLDKMDEKLLDWFGPGSSQAEKDAIRHTPGAAGTRAGAPLPKPPVTPNAPRQGSAAEQAAAAGTPTAANTRGNTVVHIGEINVNAPHATDAAGIATDMNGELQRKLLVANTDGGVS